MEDVRSIARSVLGDRNLSYGIFSGDPETLSRSVLTIVYEKNGGRPVAFNALAILDADLGGRSVEVLHLGLVMVRPRRAWSGPFRHAVRPDLRPAVRAPGNAGRCGYPA